MEYKDEYKTIFSKLRNILDEDITNAVEFITLGMKEKRNFSISFLKIVADNLTAYNELVNLSFFCRCRHFTK